VAVGVTVAVAVGVGQYPWPRVLSECSLLHVGVGAAVVRVGSGVGESVDGVDSGVGQEFLPFSDLSLPHELLSDGLGHSLSLRFLSLPHESSGRLLELLELL
jgi:hypothetical protein